ncbi:hypothetical protein H0H92_013211 [Tricholoma furcatifolium]|nr:hypothetical protein H0H92_013211 [Tricholoma furcatifolium]
MASEEQSSEPPGPQIRVTGSLLIPLLTHHQMLPVDAHKTVMDPPVKALQDLLPTIPPVSPSITVTGLTSSSSTADVVHEVRLEQLQLAREPNLMFTYELEGEASLVIENLVKDSDERRRLLADNVALELQVEALTEPGTKNGKKKKKKKKKKTQPPSAPDEVPGAPSTLVTRAELDQELSTMKEELSTMHAKLEALTKTTTRINRRILLDEARDKLLSKCGLEYDPFKDRLESSYGNTAAPVEDRAALADAVLNSALTTVERQKMVDIFTYAYGESPELQTQAED